MDDDELFELVRRNYSEVNKEYIQKQIRVVSEYLTDEQKEELRNRNGGGGAMKEGYYNPNDPFQQQCPESGRLTSQ